MTDPAAGRMSAFERAVVGALRLVPQGTRGKTRIARLATKFMLDRGETTITTLDGDVFAVPSLREPVAFHCLIDGVYEPEMTHVLREYLPVGGTFLDAGANIGVFTVRASRIVGPAGRVVAIEASPSVNPWLVRNIAANRRDNVTHIPVAITDGAVDRVPFYAAPEDHFGMGSLAAQFHSRPVEVPADTIDNLLHANGVDRVDLFKIDIEGYEAAAFRGARGLLTGAARPVVVFEFADWAEERAGMRPGDAQRELLNLGYSLHLVGDRGGVSRLDALMERGNANILALPA